MNNRLTFGFIILLALCACSPQKNSANQIQSATPLIFNSAEGFASFQIEQICCTTAKSIFKSTGSTLAMMPGSKPVWIQLPQDLDGELLLLSHPVDSAELYEYPGSEAGWQVSVTGDSVPRSGNALQVPRMAFLLDPEHNGQTNRYLRITQPTRLTLSITTQSQKDLIKQLNDQFLLRCLLFGFVLAIVLYNLVLTTITRDSVFALNALTISSLIVVDVYLTGYGAFYLWPERWSNTILNLSFTGVAVAGSAFIYLFIKPARKELPGTRWLLLPACIAIFSLPLSLIFPYWLIQTVLIINIGLFILVTMGVVTSHFFRGNERALPILIPLLFVMLPGGIAVYLRRTGLLPELITGAHILEITLALEALVFSLALGTRISFLSREAEVARRERDTVTLTSARNYGKLQDRERARIASDLHDSIGHDLVMMKSYLSQSHSDQEAVDKAQLLATNTLTTVRRISHRLHPVVVDMVGWHRAVKDLFIDLGSTMNNDIQIQDISPAPYLPKATEAHLYQILQEVTSNIIKHSGATRCELTLLTQGENLTVQVHDNGKGYSGNNDGLGLLSISQRVLAFNGKWSIKGSDKSGTTFRLTIPLEDPNDSQ